MTFQKEKTMALIEYDIQYVDGKANVTHRVVEVTPGDRIRFTSNYVDAGIKYKGGSPFETPEPPQADKVFHVGKGTTPEFIVTQRLTSDAPLLFDCGEVVKQIGTAVSAMLPPKTEYTLNSWDAGDGTPDRNSGP
jgi:hypothetical protein